MYAKLWLICAKLGFMYAKLWRREFVRMKTVFLLDILAFSCACADFVMVTVLKTGFCHFVRHPGLARFSYGEG